jgi:hypothetical protein
LKSDLEHLVEPVTRGDPESRLRWTSKSVRKLAEELNRMGHRTSHRMVAELLHELGYSLQANSKTLEGLSHADRDQQFHYINQQVNQLLARRQPVISVDTKKKELVGDFKSAGKELRPRGDPEKVRVHDFVIPELCRTAPCGVLRYRQQCGLVERRRGSRYVRLCGRNHSPLLVNTEGLQTTAKAQILNRTCVSDPDLLFPRVSDAIVA